MSRDFVAIASFWAKHKVISSSIVHLIAFHCTINRERFVSLTDRQENLCFVGRTSL